MRLSRRRRSPNSEINMTPMIDVVFLLIVFFMTVSQVSEANRVQVELPQLRGSKDQTPQTLTINVTADEQIIISGNTVSMTDVINMAQQEIAAAGGNPDLVSVVLAPIKTESVNGSTISSMPCRGCKSNGFDSQSKCPSRPMTQ